MLASFHNEEKNISSKTQDTFGIFWSICMAKARNGIYDLLDQDTIKVEREQFPAFWQQAILNTDISWNCTNYDNSPDDLYSNWAKRGFEFQSMVSKTNGISVKRLFISKNRKGTNSQFINHMKWQESLGFMIRHIYKDKKLRWAYFDNLERLIGTVDIAIINGQYLIAFILSTIEPREISFLKIYANPHIVGEVIEIFNHMWDSAVPIDSLDITETVQNGT